MLDDEFIESLLQHDDGYKLLENFSSSPSYWQKKGKDIKAMIRQLGLPSFFITLSAAETQWGELLRILKKVIDNEDVTVDEAEKFSFQEKARLIKSDPVTCSRYFDNRMKAILRIIKSKSSVFKDNPCEHFYWRIEVQQRGSLHLHGIFWMSNIPIFNKHDTSNWNDIIQIIDKYCSTDSESLENDALIKVQVHTHKNSCLREINNDKICRFKMPKPPLDRTMILLPFPEYYSIRELKQHKENFNKISDLLNYLYSNKDDEILNFTFEQFLNYLNIENDAYLNAIRSSIKCETIFLKRKVRDININCFNKQILLHHRANMDIQYILNPYSLCNYLVNYLQKSTAGISKILRDAMAEVKSGNLTVRKKLMHLSSKFVNSVEVSAQEAAYNILGLHMSEASVSTIFINTFPVDQRVKIVKSKNELQKLSPSSNDIFVQSVIDHYQNRPDVLEDMCYAEFCALYEFSKISKNQNYLKLKNKNGFVYKRNTMKVIRYRRYDMAVDSYNYYREKLMLFYPWRNEMYDILDCNFTEKIESNAQQINNN